jgi:peptidoglycan DL-endopeptidase CwlO
MRIVAVAGLFACAIVAAGSSTVNAEALDLLQVNNNESNFAQTSVLASLAVAPDEPAAEPKKAESEPVKYTVAERDSLSTIAKQHDTTWKRLFDKNEAVKNPDIIAVGDELVIPRPDEKLKERPLPQPAPEPVAPAAQQQTRTKRPAPARQPAAQRPAARSTSQARGSSAGNTYTAGYCTWYVKNRRPGLPNNLGNANTWVARASAQGMATGSTPRPGAVGQRGMHVVYVESVNGDGTVTISEMNLRATYEVTTRTLPASYFTYIY